MDNKKTGVNTSTIIDIRKQRAEWLNKGKANCSKCAWLKWGYYCDKKKRSAIEINKPKHCKFYKYCKNTEGFRVNRK